MKNITIKKLKLKLWSVKLCITTIDRYAIGGPGTIGNTQPNKPTKSKTNTKISTYQK